MFIEHIRTEPAVSTETFLLEFEQSTAGVQQCPHERAHRFIVFGGSWTTIPCLIMTSID